MVFSHCVFTSPNITTAPPSPSSFTARAAALDTDFGLLLLRVRPPRRRAGLCPARRRGAPLKKGKARFVSSAVARAVKLGGEGAERGQGQGLPALMRSPSGPPTVGTLIQKRGPWITMSMSLSLSACVCLCRGSTHTQKRSLFDFPALHVILRTLSPTSHGLSLDLGFGHTMVSMWAKVVVGERPHRNATTNNLGSCIMRT